MSTQYPGGFISKNPPLPNGSTASGIWTLNQQAAYRKANLWPSAPGAPTIGTATADVAQATVTFTAPTDIGSSAISGYTVTSNPGNITGSGASSPITVTGLVPGTAYTFTVRATNSAGTGSASSASNSVTPTASPYIEDVFSTWLYTGNGSNQTITNGIDLSGQGGLVWTKGRSNADVHILTDTVRGAGKLLQTQSTAATITNNTALSGFTASGFSIGSENNINTSGFTYASWTFREAPKFFDIITWTGDGTSGRTIAHNLGATPGCVIIKRTDSTGDWTTWHRSLPGSYPSSRNYLFLNSTGEQTTSVQPFTAAPSSTELTISASVSSNLNGATYVAYLFAHDAGGFGASGTDNVISCGTFTPSGAPVTVNLGWEPQWVLIKDAGNISTNWQIVDTMRGFPASSSAARLSPNISSSEAVDSTARLISTGFTFTGDDFRQYIYVAIRRGPMRTPTAGTSVFSPYVAASPGNAGVTTNFPVDLQIQKNAGAAQDIRFVDRLRGVSSTPTNPSSAFPFLVSSSTSTESTGTGTTLNWNNTGFTVGNTYADSAQAWAVNFRRAPGFFDEVCYTGNGVARTITHNLGVPPELIIIKARTNGGTIAPDWTARVPALGATSTVFVNLTDAAVDYQGYVWNNTNPTSTGVSLSSDNYLTNSATGSTYVMYLFASTPGVSKVGTYTGNGSSQTINCAFTTGARLVLIKRTDSTGGWLVWDSARGIVAGNDPYLVLNTTAAQVTTDDSVDTDNTGFVVNQAAASNINVNAATYIFLAIA